MGRGVETRAREAKKERKKKGERARKRENELGQGPGNEYNQNGLVERQPRAIPHLTRVRGRAFEFEF